MNIINIDSKNPDNEAILNAAAVLKNGGILVYPTDTAYGIGVNAIDKKAIRKLYEIKGRDFTKPTHIVVKDWEMVNKIAKVNEYAKKLYSRFLPGPLTIILPKKETIPNMLTANLPTIGIRIPDSLVTKSISNLVDFPYTTPSANRSGLSTPYSIKEVSKVLDLEKVDLVLDAGTLPKTKPSTIVDATAFPLKILREGPVSRKDLKNTGLEIV